MNKHALRIHNLKVGVFDDDRDDFLLVKKLLKNSTTIQSDAIWFNTFEEALSACSENSIDILLVDYRLGKYRGTEVIKKFYKENCSIPIILLTGVVDPDLGMKAIHIGAEDYITKGDLSTQILEKSILYSLERYKTKVADQKKREKEITKRFQTMIEKSADGILLLDKNHQISYASPSVKKLTDYSPSELDGAALSVFIPAEHFKTFKKTFEILEQTDKDSVQIETKIQTKSGKTRWIFCTVTNLLDEPAIEALVINFHDITKRKQLQKTKDEFIGIASHELKTPLTTVKGYIQLLSKKLKGIEDKKINNYIQQTEKYVNKLERLISDLLDVSKIESGKLELTMEVFCLETLVENLLTSLQHISSSHQLVFKRGERIYEVIGDKERIEQIITNLVSNAIKYSPNSDKVEVEVSQNNSNSVKVSVQDYGIGIAKEEQKHLFQRFFRAKKTSANISGHGIDLYIAAELVKRHNGTIEVQSEEGEGSSFSFTIPLHASTKIV